MRFQFSRVRLTNAPDNGEGLTFAREAELTSISGGPYGLRTRGRGAGAERVTTGAQAVMGAILYPDTFLKYLVRV